MKNCTPLISLFLLLLFNIPVIYPQNISYDNLRSVFKVSKPLDLDFDHYNFDEIPQELPSNLYQTQFSKDYIFNYLTYDPVRDPKRLAYNTGLVFGAALIEFAVLWNLPEDVSNWSKDEIFNKKRIHDIGLTGIWKENIQAGPVWDDDGVFFNWIAHPWAGGVYYMAARGSGFKRWESFSYSFLMSTLFWEFGVEAVAEVPSWQDIIVTPVIGSLVGEQFFKWKGKIIQNNKKVLNSRFLGFTSLFIMDPFNQILNGLGYKTKNEVRNYSSISPLDYDLTTGKPIWGIQIVMTF